ncbi:hypothetical protein LCM20_09205 [Halobacillus litoralis]|uniref:hypothetical protein n=1 Tax=Halobacillus litoralis TaxID=45668 RepID=UPI001CD254A6|nr:hypothetical protein [Halobacillus litoralis]MCA0970765.1 hypothetical protein [Halobacillus litoralis]
MTYEEMLEEETIDQKSIYRKGIKNGLYGLMGVSAVAIGFEWITGSVPQFMYALLLLSAISTLWDYVKSRESNESLWRKWEVRWSQRKTLYMAKRVVNLTVSILFFQYLSGLGMEFAIGGLVGSVVAGWGDTIKRWQVKNEYLEEFKRECAGDGLRDYT